MRARDEEAFRLWAEANTLKLRRYTCLLHGDWHQASDFTQKALVKVYVRWRRLHRGNPTGYAHMVILNAVRDEVGSARAQRIDASGVLPEIGVHDEYDLGAREELLLALQALPLGMRKAVVLRYWLDYSVEDAAAIMACSPGNVKSQASRGLSKLREHIQLNEGID